MIAVGTAVNQFGFAYLILEAELGYDSSFQPFWQLSDTVMKKYTYYTWFNENFEILNDNTSKLQKHFFNMGKIMHVNWGKKLQKLKKMLKLKTETIGENISPRDINVQINKHKHTNKHERYSRHH